MLHSVTSADRALYDRGCTSVLVGNHFARPRTGHWLLFPLARRPCDHLPPPTQVAPDER
jgi:hypothetical protein